MRRATRLLVLIVVASVAPAALTDGVCAGKACCAKAIEGVAITAPSCCNTTNCSTRRDEPAEIARNGAPDHGRALSLSSPECAGVSATAPLHVGTTRSDHRTAAASPAERVVALSILRI